MKWLTKRLERKLRDWWQRLLGMAGVAVFAVSVEGRRMMLGVWSDKEWLSWQK